MWSGVTVAPSLPFHIQLFRALGFSLPKYVHIGPLMKMDGTSKRKLSKRKDPELALTFYKSRGVPGPGRLRVCHDNLLNSNYEDWRRANPTAQPRGIPLLLQKAESGQGALFDYAKLCDVSKNVISTMTAQEAYDLVLEYAQEFDPEFGEVLAADPAYATAILAIGRGGKKPRKDLATWKEAKPYMGFFYDRYFDAEAPFPASFPAETVRGGPEWLPGLL